MKKTPEEVYSELLKNVEEDRERAKTAYELTLDELGRKVSDMSQVGPVMVKAIETLIKSNEQLVKLTAILANKKEAAEEEEFNPADFLKSINEAEEKKKAS